MSNSVLKVAAVAKGRRARCLMNVTWAEILGSVLEEGKFAIQCSALNRDFVHFETQDAIDMKLNSEVESEK